MSNLILPGQRNGNGSASERRIAVLSQALAQSNEAVDHLRAHVAVLVTLLGGEVVIPVCDLQVVYDLSAAVTPDELGITWKAAPRLALAAPAPIEESQQ